MCSALGAGFNEAFVADPPLANRALILRLATARPRRTPAEPRPPDLHRERRALGPHRPLHSRRSRSARAECRSECPAPGPDAAPMDGASRTADPAACRDPSLLRG